MMRTIILAILSLIGVATTLLHAQEEAVSVPGSNAPAERPSINLKRLQDPIVLDGILDEKSWYSGIPADRFWQNFPIDSVLARGGTEIYMTYDDQTLYVGVKCYSNGEDYIVPTLKRDYSFRNNDNISILFDTYNDQTNAFLFGMNAYGVRREALISNGGRQRGDFSESWDNKWFGEVKIHGDYWIAEFAIPFKTLRFNSGGQRWRFNCYRNDTQTNEISTWIRIPRNQIIMDLTYMGDMVWEDPLPKTGKNISLIPYAITGVSRDFEDTNQEKADFTWNMGGDAKIAVTSGLNLDLTANPDFSQVEVDRQVTNLSRFELFFPERRQFFLENADLFGSFGNIRTNPFFSRRIGIIQDTLTDENIANPIYYGARLSGKLNDNFRLGLMNMQTAKNEENGLPGFNHTVMALQQKVFKRSNISFIFVNKQAINGEKDSEIYDPYNRVVGLEYRLASADNRWSGKTYYHQAITPNDEAHKFSHATQIAYIRRKYRLEWAHVFVGNGFDAQLGFIPRKDFLLLSPEFGWFFYPKKGPLSQHTFNLDYRLIFKVGKEDTDFLPKNDISDRELELSWDFNFKNTARASLELNNTFVFLFESFDPTRIQEEDVFLEGNTTYNYTSLSANFNSDFRKKFTYRLEPTIGQFFNGFRAGLSGRLSMRFQPYATIGLNYNYNHIRLDAPFKTANLWLIGPRVDITFTKKLFFSSIFQYNNQSDNLGINARFQWRFQPVSDFFIVYTDNYFTNSFSQFEGRNRALVAKLTYWLNL